MQKLQPHQTGMMAKKPNQEEETTFLPLTEVEVKVEIVDSIAHINMTQHYENPERLDP